LGKEASIYHSFLHVIWLEQKLLNLTQRGKQLVDKCILNPIGKVLASVKEPVDDHWGDVRSRIMLDSQFGGALVGLEDFSHALILTYLHKAEFVPAKHLQRRPRGIKSMPKVGIFSQRVKDRPNPIGVTAVEIVEVGYDYLDVRGLDAIDQTPVIDIKPYFPHYDKKEPCRIPEWVNCLMENYF
jgi:tRNA-Thr(GGU) m(6)t(6)A37 methyltransferase TsaA